jgi:predicted transcriptional regulator of viral defense system
MEFIKSHGGYVHMNEMKKNRFSPALVKALREKGILERVKAGLYRPVDIDDIPDVSIGFVDVSKAIPDGIIGLISALHYFELTTLNPSSIYLVVPHNKKVPPIEYPPTKIFYFRKRFFEVGIEVIDTPYGPIKIYNREKTICDMFRYRKKLGEDIALEALKNYISYKQSDFHKLMEFAEICQVKTTISPYLKALLV